MYLPFLIFLTPCEMRKSSEIEIWRRDERSSLNAMPLIAVVDDLAGTMDRITLNRDVLLSLCCMLLN